MDVRQERRLAAILVADIVGYSRLMAANETETHARVQAILAELVEPLIATHRGQIVKLMGDSVLVEFASVVEAVACAVDIQRATGKWTADLPDNQRIAFRIGVHLGDVIAERGDLYGHGVNVAARLETLADPGGICISQQVLDHIEGRSDVAFADLGEQRVKNIARPIRTYRVEWTADDRIVAPELAASPSAWPAIAVLPFTNMGDDPEQDYFADGLTEDIITALSHWRSFPVIARNSTFTYKGRAVRVQQVASELKARYVVEGSVRRAGQRLRISAQLIEATTGHHLWAERYDRNLADTFAVVDEISERIVAAILPELELTERKRAATKPPQSLDAWECWQRGMAYKDELTSDGYARARAMFERAIALDPTFAKPHTWLAWLYQDDHDELFISPPEESLTNWLASARRAIALDPNEAWAYVALGFGLQRAGRHDDAVRALEEAIAVNPSHSFAHVILGNVLGAVGRLEEAISMIERGIQLNPRDPMLSFMMLQSLAFKHLYARRYEQAIEWAQKSIQQRPDNPIPYVALASSLGHLDRGDEGLKYIEKCEQLRAGFPTKHAQTMSNPTYREHLLNGLRKCGWQG